jgi:hypothetical protein
MARGAFGPEDASGNGRSSDASGAAVSKPAPKAPPPPPVEHYIGVLHSLSADDQDPLPGVKKPIELFLWHYMARRTTLGDAAQAAAGSSSSSSSSSSNRSNGDGDGDGGSGGEGCDFRGAKCPDGSVCVGARYTPGGDVQRGLCRQGTVR